MRGKIEVVQSGDRKKAGKNQILSFGSNLGLCSFSKSQIKATAMAAVDDGLAIYYR